MNIAQLTFGRNVGTDGPMTDRSWLNFKLELTSALFTLVGVDNIKLHEYAEGTGVWENATEISGKITIGYFRNIVPERLAEFYELVTAIREYYQQDAIAFTLGNSELI